MNKYIISTCTEGIPCNPCVDSCKVQAITKKCLVSTPEINNDCCIGCKNCVAQCPGQALYFFQDLEDSRSAITFPFEFLPLPKKNDSVDLVNIEGHIIGKGTVLKVDNPVAFNKIPLITVSGTKDVIRETRSIRRGE